MSSLKELLTSRKFWRVLLSALVLITVCVGFLTWLTDSDWWRWNDGDGGEEDRFKPKMTDEYVKDVKYQLRNVRCPAKKGLELEDYWRCLWRTSITPEGLEQHKRILWRNYVDRVNDELEGMRGWANKTFQGNQTLNERMKKMNLTAKKTRVRRQTSPVEELYYGKTFFFLLDLLFPYFNGIADQDELDKVWQGFKICQQKVFPGVSLQKFLYCVRRLAWEFGRPEASGDPTSYYGTSFNKTYQPTSLPPFRDIYDQPEEFPLLRIPDKNDNNKPTLLKLEFKPLGIEEHLDNFAGADPFFEDAWSPFRYKYSGDTKQRQVGWTYHGQDEPDKWHELDLERFVLPLHKFVDLKKIGFLPELAQTYPGVGEVAEQLDDVDAPLDYRWNKDRGYNVYTRFLLPLLKENDLEYYKGKGLVDSSVKLKTDAKQLQDITKSLDQFESESIKQIFDLYEYNVTAFYLGKKESDVEFANSYNSFMSHFFSLDLGRYRALKKVFDADSKGELWFEMEISRLLLRAYEDAVNVQMKCLAAMLKEQEVRLEDEQEISDLIESAKKDSFCKNKLVDSDAEAIKVDFADLHDNEYKLNKKNLRFLYDSYFDRKDARQRYSIPKYPIPFPICRHNEPSPIDIQTDHGRKSSLRDYSFGPAAYRLNRFFMFYPLDGSPLLTVGIVDGERLDASSVRLTGGAVRGQNLTFQYMHIRFGSNWEKAGSEHWIDGKGAQMELQMVFTVAGSADSIKYWHVLARVHNQLFQFREKLVIILSVLVDVLKDEKAVEKHINDNNLNQDPNLFEPFAQAAYHFKRVKEKYGNYEQPRGFVSIDPAFRFIDFIPRKSSKFYTYRGSLSWPPCFGYVIWSVYEQRLYMSKRQFDQFTQIPAYGIQDFNLASDNYREFGDIWVEEENVGTLTWDQVNDLKRLRTVDRHVLVGFHDVSQDGSEVEEEGVVGEEIYYLHEESRCSGGLKGVIVLIASMTVIARMF